MMKFKKFKTAAAAGLMAAVMCMGTVVSAAEEPTVPTAKAEIQKDFQIAEGITVPGITFTFTFAGLEADAPVISAKTVDYSNADTVTSGISSKTVAEIFSEATFPHAGVYTYTVKETAGETSVENGTVTYDGSVYTVRVYVKNTENGGLAIDQITAAKSGAAGTEEKQDAIKFVNKFEKTTSLTVAKHTEGALADKTKAFTFKVTFTKPATYDGSTFVSGNDTYTFGQEYTFTLADGGQKVFSNLPAGTRYVVTEVGAADGYAPSVTVVENGTQTVTNKTAADADSLAAAETGKTNLAGEGTNTVTFTNTYKDVPITGIIMNNLPFVILILAAAAGLVGYLVIRRKVAR